MTIPNNLLHEVILTEYGYYKLREVPSEKELEKYYSEKYYQENKGSYQSEYSSEEIQFFKNKIEQKYLIINELISAHRQPGKPSFLDVGCGEGWALNFFEEKGWQVKGIDYSNHGCRVCNPQSLKNLTTGDIFNNLDLLIERKNKFDVIWLTNVLEHVRDPLMLLQKIKILATPDTILILQVPNDFSKVQLHLLEKGHIEHPFWVAKPDHISYFSYDSLKKMMLACEWHTEKIIADFPIDFNLFNDVSNYINNPNIGKNIHLMRVEVENLLHNSDPIKTNEMYEKMAELGVGRQITGFFRFTGGS